MKDEILRLRAEGKSYRDIVKTLGCSISTVSYHCDIMQRNKTHARVRKCKAKMHPYKRKLIAFTSRKFISKNRMPIRSDRRLLTDKIYDFLTRYHQNIGDTMQTITDKDVIDKFGQNPKCYLTGNDIDINKPRTYHFDHKVPVSRGGTNTLDNLEICTKKANNSKSDMTHDEFVEFCKTVLIHHGYQISK